MKTRCYCKTNDRYKNYGGREITICKEWLEDFKNFYNWAINNGYQDDLTIDRIDVNGNYEPSNCRWITNYEQQSNKTDNRLITYNGETKTIAQWAREYDLKWKTLESRLNRNWNIEKALNTKPKKIHKNRIFEQYTKENVKIIEWTRKEIESCKNFNISNIYKCCNGHIKSVYGYIWKFKEDKDGE